MAFAISVLPVLGWLACIIKVLSIVLYYL